MKIIAIANQKGGVGKTTTAVNLGCALAERGQRILIVDLDPQANATSALGMQEIEAESIYESLLRDAPIAERILPTRIDNLFIVTADLDLAGAELEIARMPDHLMRLSKALLAFRSDETFDLVCSRHPVRVNWCEIARVLAPDGRYLAQHVGGGANAELREYFLGPLDESDSRHQANESSGAREAGLEILQCRNERLKLEFFDVGAVAYFLRKVIWTVPDFSIDRW